MTTTAMTVLGFCIIFIATTAGAALVFIFKGELSGKLNTLFLGFASGVMVAASVWSLLIPSIEGAEETYGSLSFLPAVIGFLLGGAFLVLIDKLVPHFHKGTNEEEGLKSHLKKPAKLFFAVTIHNIPEGLAVGFAFGAAAALGEQGAFVSALGLAVGMASGAVEPVFAVVGYFLAANLTAAQPWFLAFAAGAMIFVVVEDLIPDAHLSEHPHFGTWGAMLGFVVMMALDVALG